MKEYITVLTPIILAIITLVSSWLSWRYKANRSDLAKMMNDEQERDKKIQEEFVKIRNERDAALKELKSKEDEEHQKLYTEFDEIKNENIRLRREIDEKVVQLKLCEDNRISLLKRIAEQRRGKKSDSD